MEIWKPIINYEGLYEVSNCGRVRSKDRICKCLDRNVKRRGKIIKPYPNSKGYLRVYLSDKNGNKKNCFIHRLVAQTFIKNPKKLPVVNHKDFNPQNNNVENLEWTTFIGNIRYSIDCGRFIRTGDWKQKLKQSLDKKFGKSVIGTNIKDGKRIYFKALNDCTKAGFQPSCVSNCCNGKRNKHKGYTWRFADEV